MENVRPLDRETEGLWALMKTNWDRQELSTVFHKDVAAQTYKGQRPCAWFSHWTKRQSMQKGARIKIMDWLLRAVAVKERLQTPDTELLAVHVFPAVFLQVI